MGQSRSLEVLKNLIPLMPHQAFLLDKGQRICSSSLTQNLSFGLTATQHLTDYQLSTLPFFTEHPQILTLWKDKFNLVFDSKCFLSAELLCWDFNKNLIMRHYALIPIMEKANTITAVFCTAHLIEEHLLQNPIYPSNESFKTILKNLPGHVYWKDREGHYLGCNTLQAHDLNLSSCDDIIGKTDYDFSSKEQSDLIRIIDQKVISEGKEMEIEEKIKIKGESVIVLSRKIPLYTREGIICGILGISMDISDRKAREHELQVAKNRAEIANVAKTEFLNNMRHDIRTPLSGIVGFSEILKSESNEPRIKEYADNLIASSHALLSLLDEVLETVKVSAGEIPMIKRKFDLLETMEHVVALFLAKAQEKRLTLTLKLSENLPRFVIGDKIRVHRIAMELVGNALNFTNTGYVTLTVDLAKKNDNNFIIKLMVIDSGIGIPKDKQEEIYMQFKRLTPSYHGTYKGAGLGLYVVKQFIDELNGEIYVESKLHKGTCFTCLIPLQEPLLNDASGIDSNKDFKKDNFYSTPISPPFDTMPSPIESKPEHSSNHILVVEDNLIAQSVAKALLIPMFCDVDTASNGEEALTLYEKNHYDLIFIDIGLGEGMDGYEVARHIRSHTQFKKTTPIVGLTAHAGDENKQRCIDAGMDAVLTKPLTQAQAIEILKTFIPARNVATSTMKTVPNKMVQLDQYPLLDDVLALKNCGNNKEMLIELLTLMIDKEVPEDLDIMKRAYAERDFALVEKMAHKIKGGAMYVGTTRLKYACEYLERYKKTGESELFDSLYLQTVKCINESCYYIKDWLAANTITDTK